jgi:hypothetical protein
MHDAEPETDHEESPGGGLRHAARCEFRRDVGVAEDEIVDPEIPTRVVFDERGERDKPHERPGQPTHPVGARGRQIVRDQCETAEQEAQGGIDLHGGEARKDALERREVEGPARYARCSERDGRPAANTRDECTRCHPPSLWSHAIVHGPFVPPFHRAAPVRFLPRAGKGGFQRAPRSGTARAVVGDDLVCGPQAERRDPEGWIDAEGGRDHRA